MGKSCDNCYWESYIGKFCFYEENRPLKNLCIKHSLLCNGCYSETATHEYRKKHYCIDCLLEKFEVVESTITHYYDSGGDYLGSNDNTENVIKMLSDEIKEIEQ